jgi:hypothetical protein
MSFNPYQAPTSAYDGNFTNPSSGAVVSARIVAALRKTRPWVVFISVMFYIGAGGMFLSGLASLAQVGAPGLVSIVLGVLYLLPAIALTRYSKGINKLLHGGGVTELEESMDAQASFWQISGIFTLIGIVLMVILMVFMGAMFSSMSRGF